MEPNDSDSRRRLLRIGLIIALLMSAIRSFRRGKQLRAGLTGIAAFALGYGMSKDTSELLDDTEIELAAVHDVPTHENRREMRCSICEEPIVAGQGRRPHANRGTVHDACLEN